MADKIYRWVKADVKNLPKGKEHEYRSIKYKDKPDTLVMIDTRWCWVGNSLLESAKYPVKEDSWSAIEWLCEIEADQHELWEGIKQDIKTADKCYVPLRLIVKWKKQFHLTPKHYTL